MFFFFKNTATTEIYTLSLHDALPICAVHGTPEIRAKQAAPECGHDRPRRPRQDHPDRRHHQDPGDARGGAVRSEEHTSELQSRQYLVCRLLLEKKKSS